MQSEVNLVEETQAPEVPSLTLRRKISLGLGVLLAVLLVSQGDFDPTPLSPMWPAQGVQNWLGLPGSLLAGALFDLWGRSSYLMIFAFLLLVKKPQSHPVAAGFFLFLSQSMVTLFLSLSLPLSGAELVEQVGMLGYFTRDLLTGTPFYYVGLGVSFAFLIRMGYGFQLDLAPYARLATLFWTLVAAFAVLVPYFKEAWAGLVALIDPIMNLPARSVAGVKEKKKSKENKDHGEGLELEEALRAYEKIQDSKKIED